KRHAFIASLLKIPHIAVCINKMDLVEYKQEVYEEIKQDFRNFASKLDTQDVRFIPISALNGDNVVKRSENMDWYEGVSLLYLLETIHIASDENMVDCRFPVQYVIRPNNDEYHDYRGYAGSVVGGIYKPGDKVMVLPSGFTSKIKSIDSYDGPVEEAFPPMAVTIRLEDEIDISRGDMIVRENNSPSIGQDFDIMICWMNERKLLPKNKYYIKHTSKDAKCIVKEIRYKVDINTLHRIEDTTEIGLNEIGRISIRTTSPFFYDKYKINRNTGSVILIDEGTNETVGAGMII
ncbi:MAG: sulfate adenylyltransferase, partial [Bacteroidetes bacterium]|nr:sulfate adenylyltransferase [Bacteroidota bacterium]